MIGVCMEKRRSREQRPRDMGQRMEIRAIHGHSNAFHNSHTGDNTDEQP